MNLTWLDGLIISLYLAFNLGIGFFYRRQAGRSIEQFFISGRSSPWWLAGTSMAATTFASDTPLAITGMVATGGIAGNWFWWSFAFSGMLTVFVYSRLWRRANVVTDVEFAEIRYSGRPAAFLRGFRALYLAIPINCIVMGWVSLAMVKVLMLILDIDKMTAILAVFALTAITCAISGLAGLQGVLITDLAQFALMGSLSIALANFAVVGVGGLNALTKSVIEVRGEAALGFFPDFDSAWMPISTFFVYMAVNWWATWYPGSEPGGGGFIAQRMFSTRDERHSMLATLWFNIVHYALRPWPWILVSLVSLVVYPDLADPESGYVLVMIDYLPSSARGLMIAGFAAAFMSTISTLLNWGASYLSSDIYQRFINPAASDHDLVTTSRITTISLAVIAAIVTFYMESIGGAWKLLLATGAGTGGVLILRWFWWRINAWSEVSAMATAFILSIALQWQMKYDIDNPNDFAIVMLWTVSVTTIVWVTVTLFTGPEPYDKLLQFYKRVRPYPLFWGPISTAAGDKYLRHGLIRDIAYWLIGCGLIYGALFGIGKLLLGEPAISVAWFVLCAVCSWTIHSGLRNMKFSD